MIEIRGLKKVELTVEAGRASAPKTTAKAVLAVANRIFAESQTQVPVMFGVLKASGNVSDVRMTGEGCEVEIFYGGPATDYAAYQHYTTGLNHPHGKDHFLSDPFDEAAPSIAREINTRIAAMLGAI